MTASGPADVAVMLPAPVVSQIAGDVCGRRQSPTDTTSGRSSSRVSSSPLRSARPGRQAPPRRVPGSLPGALSRADDDCLRGRPATSSRRGFTSGPRIPQPRPSTATGTTSSPSTTSEAEHWLHLRTSNPIESVFARVRLRTNVAKRARVRENALCLVFKIVQRLRSAAGSGTPPHTGRWAWDSLGRAGSG